jgi:hypothetical protein
MNRIKDVYKIQDSEWVTLEVIDNDNVSHFMDVKAIDLAAYEDGELIQSCFPYLSNEQREIIISGLTDDMWGTLFR